MTSTQLPEPNGGRSLRRQEVTDRIKRYILDNRLRPGDLLPTENELCAALGASRSSVREAVKTLDALDIVEVRHGHGTYVGRLSLSALVEGLTFRGLLSPGDDFRVLAELVDVRELIERGMAEQIIAALDAGAHDGLDALVAEMESLAGKGETFAEVDRQFHALLVQPVGNDLIAQLSSAFWDVYAIVAPYLNLMSVADEMDTVAAHREMAVAARAGDAARFGRAVVEHYRPVRHRLARATADDPRSPS